MTITATKPGVIQFTSFFLIRDQVTALGQRLGKNWIQETDDLVGETGFSKVPSVRYNSLKVHRMVDIRTPNFMRLIADWQARGPQFLFAD